VKIPLKKSPAGARNVVISDGRHVGVVVQSVHVGQARLNYAIFNIVRAMVAGTLPPTLEALLEAYDGDAALRGDILDESLADTFSAFWSDPRLAFMRQGALALGAALAESAPGPARDDALLILARRLVVCIPPEVFVDMKNADAAIGARQDAAYFTQMLRAFVVEYQELTKEMEENSSGGERD
jgi:hypothetical protein